MEWLCGSILIKMDKKTFLLNFIKQHKIAVLATMAEDNKPEAAAIGFGETDSLEIIFGTYTSTRKYQNLQKNQHVAIVIGWDDDKTIQYEGMATELSGDEADRCASLYHKKNPAAVKFAQNPAQRYFKVTPTWLRYVNLTQSPDENFELTF